MPARLYHTQRWSEEDDELLRTMSAAGKSLTLMTVKLKRPMALIKVRAIDLGISIPGTDIGKRRKKRETAWPGLLRAASARAAGGQDYEARYEAKETRKSASAVKKAVKKVGSSRKRVEKASKRGRR